MGERSARTVARGVVAALAAVLVLAGCAPGPTAPTGSPADATAPAAGAPARATGPATAPLPAPGTGVGPRVCDPRGSVPVAGGRYEVQNNRWGADTPQCTTAFDTGFSVSAAHDKESGPAAYPSIVWGCNYGTCTRDTPFPRPLADLGDVRSSWAYRTPGSGDYNAAYDVWLDPTPRRAGANTGAELMIWLDHTDRVRPIGSAGPSVRLGGASWTVWAGENQGTPVISYVRDVPSATVVDLPVSDFVRDATDRGVVRPEWFLTNLQAGFEPWIGGDGLVTDAFAATRDGV